MYGHDASMTNPDGATPRASIAARDRAQWLLQEPPGAPVFVS